MLAYLSGADLERLMDSIGTPTFLVSVAADDKFPILYANAALHTALQQVGGLGAERSGALLQAPVLRQHYCHCARTGEPEVFETTLELPTGERWLRITLNPVRDRAGNGTVVRLLGTAIDITEERRAQEALRYQHLLLKTQQDLTPDGILVADNEGNVLSWNRRFCELWGLTDDVLAQGRGAILPFLLDQAADPAMGRTKIDRLFSTGADELGCEELQLKNGKVYQLLTRRLIDEDPLGRGRIWFCRDITESKRSERKLSEAYAMQQAILSSASQMVITVDRDLVIRSFNPAAERTLGYKAEELIGKHTPLLFHDPDELEERRTLISRELGRDLGVIEMFQENTPAGKAEVSDWHFIRKDGSRLPVELSVTRLEDGFGRHLGFLGIATDITERRQTERRLFELATTDTLTGLWNRRHFTEHAQKALLRANRYNEHMCLAVIDIDFFKRINDTCGHAAGDAVLVAVARALSIVLRRSDFICRWGGEEFAVLLVNTDPAEALQVCERMREAVSAVSISHEGKMLHATISIGLSDCLSCGHSLDVMLSRADQALYAAKAAGRNRINAVWSELQPPTVGKKQPLG